VKHKRRSSKTDGEGGDKFVRPSIKNSSGVVAMDIDGGTVAPKLQDNIPC
jgi:hypothetical protein